MRAFSLLSLVIVLLVVAVLARKQLAPVRPVSDGKSPASASSPQAVQRQIQNEINGLMQERASQVNRGEEER